MWLVFNIGCIECGVSSNVVGVFDDEETANKVAKELSSSHSWREGGQNSFKVYKLPEINILEQEYTEPPK